MLLFIFALAVVLMLWVIYRIDAKCKKSEKKNQQINLLYAALNQCHQAIIRCTNKSELFARICQDTVIFGGFRTVWIGVYEEQSERLRIDACYGEGMVCLQGIGTLSSVDDLDEERKKFGWKESISLPLHQNGEIIGTFNLHSSQTDAFDDVALALIKGMAGDIDYALTMFEKEAVRVSTEQELKKTQERLHGLLDAMSEGAYGVDINGICTFVNKAFLKILGYENANEILGQEIHKLILHSLSDEYPGTKKQRHMQTVFHNHKSMNVVGEVFWSKENKAIPVEYWSNPIVIDGEVRGAMVTFVDISERRIIENQLLKLSKAVEHSPNTIVMTDLNGKIEYVNTAFVKNTGYALSDVIGKSHHSLRSGVQDEVFYKNLKKTIKKGKIWHGELANRRKDGTLYWEEMHIVPITNEHKIITNYIAIKKNITEEKRLYTELLETNIILNNTTDVLKEREEKLKKMNKHLLELVKEESAKIIEKEKLLMKQSKMAAMGEMVGMIAHQWRQPLNAVSAAAIKLNVLNEMNSLTTEELHNTSTFIQDMSQKMSRTINDFMDFAKPDRKKEVVNVKEVLDGILKIIDAQLTTRNIILINEVQESLELTTYKHELSHALMNFLSNARDAFNDKDITNKTITIRAYEEGDHVIIEIADNAGGIDVSIMERIFEPFFTTKPMDKGTGLGLYMSKKMIEEDLNGSVSAVNANGGALFKVELLIA